jgi:hypothetical protein
MVKAAAMECDSKTGHIQYFRYLSSPVMIQTPKQSHPTPSAINQRLMKG